MDIVVAVKQSGQLDDEFELTEDGSDVDKDFVDWELNEWDAFAVEEALRWRERTGGEVTIVSVGADLAVDALRAGLAMGADRAVRVLAPAERVTDPLSVAMLLAKLVEQRKPDLFLTGVQSSDAASGVVGSAVAGFAAMPVVAVVKGIEEDPAGLRVERELEGGVVETLQVPLPAVLTIQTGINEPRYATLRAIKQAERQELEVLGPVDLGVSDAEVLASAGASRRGVRLPERSSAELIEGSAEDAASRIAEIVRDRLAA